MASSEKENLATLEMKGMQGTEEDGPNGGIISEQEKLVKNALSDEYGNADVGSNSVEDTCTSNDVQLSNCCSFIAIAQTTVSNFFLKNKSILCKVALVACVILYGIYLTVACYMNLDRAKYLLIATGVVIVWLFYKVLSPRLASRFHAHVWIPLQRAVKPKWCIIKWILIVAVVLVVVVLVAVLIGNRVKQYTGLAGLAVFVLILFLTSHNPAKVNWRPVLTGMLLNFILAMLILKTEVGLSVFNLLAQQVTVFLNYTDAGARFVFGRDTFTNHFFAFKILPTIVFFSCVISLLYYIGVMQVVIQKIAYIMQITMGTTATESLCCAGNIFVGQTEAPILVRPFLAHMTKSELHAVMTGGFATIAGGVLAAFIGMGIDPVHLIAASVMNAPMALAVSKLTYPEEEAPKYAQGRRISFAKPTEQNLVEAAASGASQSIGLVANIAANLIAFLALLAFINGVLHWIGSLVDFPELSFEFICSYLFWIVALLMGVERKDCGAVAELIGTKLVINEFLAYEKLSEFIKNRDTCTAPYMDKKSEIIATYALCGFANLSSIGIQLGGIGAMVPDRRSDLAKLVIRALIAGFMVTLMTATIAGILITDYSEYGACYVTSNSTTLNSTALNSTASNSTAHITTTTVLP